MTSSANKDIKLSIKIIPKISRLTMMSVLKDANVRGLSHTNLKQMWKRM